MTMSYCDLCDVVIIIIIIIIFIITILITSFSYEVVIDFIFVQKLLLTSP